jgi:hypothetical protein
MERDLGTSGFRTHPQIELMAWKKSALKRRRTFSPFRFADTRLGAALPIRHAFGYAQAFILSKAARPASKTGNDYKFLALASVRKKGC